MLQQIVDSVLKHLKGIRIYCNHSSLLMVKKGNYWTKDDVISLHIYVQYLRKWKIDFILIQLLALLKTSLLPSLREKQVDML